MRVSDLPGLIKAAGAAWWNDNAPSMGAALSYYATFSLAPLLLIVISVAGLVFGTDAARDAIVAQAQMLVGASGATAIRDLLRGAGSIGTGVAGTVTGIAALLVGATSVLAELQSDLDRIWRVPPASVSGMWNWLQSRLLTIGLIIAIGFLLLVSLVVSAALAAIGKWWGGVATDKAVILEAVNLVLSLISTAVLFMLIYKILPRARVAWRDVWIGSTLTAVLFVIGKFVIGWYVGRSGIASGFGAAASLVLVLIWVYFSAQIFLFGAEFTWLYASRHGSRRSGR